MSGTATSGARPTDHSKRQPGVGTVREYIGRNALDMVKLKIALARDETAPKAVRSEAAGYIVDQYIGKPTQPSVDLTPQPSPLEGVSVEDLRLLLAFLRAHPGELELILAQAKALVPVAEARANASE